MRRLTVLAVLVAATLCASTAAAGEKIKLPTGPATAKPQVTTAIQHGSTPIANVAWPARALRNGWYPGSYGGGYYSPYYTYRPYYYGYSTPYNGYYTAPYYGYSYYAPGVYYGGPRVAVGVGPLGGTVW
jgi:hypothetical protein